MNLSSIKQEAVSPPRLSFGRCAETPKPAAVGGTSKEVPGKYYWARDPASIVPQARAHICGEDKGKNPLTKEYVAFTCCPPSLILEDFRINPLFKPPPAQKVSRDSKKRPAEDMVGSTLPGNLEGKSASLSQEPVIIPGEKGVTREAQPQPTEKASLTVGTTRNVTIESEDSVMVSPFSPPPSPSDSSKVSNLEKSLATLTPEEPLIMPKKEVEVTSEVTNIFCQLCQRSYLTKATYDWHVARHLKCEECGCDMRRSTAPDRDSTFDILDHYCVTCAEEKFHGYDLVDHIPVEASAKERDEGEDENVDEDDITTEEEDEEERVFRRPPGRPRKFEDYDTGVKEAKMACRGRPSRKMNLRCRKCGMEFSCKDKLQRHVCQTRKKVRSEGGVSYVCKLCGKKCDSKVTTLHHFKMHAKENSSCECGTCGEWFWSAKNLEVHMTTHWIGGEFSCVVCRKDCESKADLYTHQSQTLYCRRSLFKFLKEDSME